MRIAFVEAYPIDPLHKQNMLIRSYHVFQIERKQALHYKPITVFTKSSQESTSQFPLVAPGVGYDQHFSPAFDLRDRLGDDLVGLARPRPSDAQRISQSSTPCEEKGGN